MEYRQELIARFWGYANHAFAHHPDYLEESSSDTRPPVFLRDEAWRNVLLRPDASSEAREAVLSYIPKKARQRWFRSMSSSQALALSVFGNLKYYRKTGLLDGLRCERGLPLFNGRDLTPESFVLEYEVGHLREPRPTSIDVFLASTPPLAIECKLTEPEIGACSRPRLAETDSQYCDGNYSVQNGRLERCPLTERGILYWRYAPGVFYLDPMRDYSPCPLKLGYQIVRNILATVGSERDGLEPASSRALLLYDARNPAFQPGGLAHKAFDEVSGLLKNRDILRKCSWQALVAHLRTDQDVNWLTEALGRKYGF